MTTLQEIQQAREQAQAQRSKLESQRAEQIRQAQSEKALRSRGGIAGREKSRTAQAQQQSEYTKQISQVKDYEKQLEQAKVQEESRLKENERIKAQAQSTSNLSAWRQDAYARTLQGKALDPQTPQEIVREINLKMQEPSFRLQVERGDAARTTGTGSDEYKSLFIGGKVRTREELVLSPTTITGTMSRDYQTINIQNYKKGWNELNLIDIKGTSIDERRYNRNKELYEFKEAVKQSQEAGDIKIKLGDELNKEAIEIENERSKINTESQSEVDNFNKRIDKFNEKYSKYEKYDKLSNKEISVLSGFTSTLGLPAPPSGRMEKLSSYSTNPLFNPLISAGQIITGGSATASEYAGAGVTSGLNKIGFKEVKGDLSILNEPLTKAQQFFTFEPTTREDLSVTTKYLESKGVPTKYAKQGEDLAVIGSFIGDTSARTISGGISLLQKKAKPFTLTPESIGGAVTYTGTKAGEIGKYFIPYAGAGIYISERGRDYTRSGGFVQEFKARPIQTTSDIVIGGLVLRGKYKAFANVPTYVREGNVLRVMTRENQFLKSRVSLSRQGVKILNPVKGEFAKATISKVKPKVKGIQPNYNLKGINPQVAEVNGVSVAKYKDATGFSRQLLEGERVTNIKLYKTFNQKVLSVGKEGVRIKEITPIREYDLVSPYTRTGQVQRQEIISFLEKRGLAPESTKSMLKTVYPTAVEQKFRGDVYTWRIGNERMSVAQGTVLRTQPKFNAGEIKSRGASPKVINVISPSQNAMPYLKANMFKGKFELGFETTAKDTGFSKGFVSSATAGTTPSAIKRGLKYDLKTFVSSVKKAGKVKIETVSYKDKELLRFKPSKGTNVVVARDTNTFYLEPTKELTRAKRYKASVVSGGTTTKAKVYITGEKVVAEESGIIKLGKKEVKDIDFGIEGGNQKLVTEQLEKTKPITAGKSEAESLSGILTLETPKVLNPKLVTIRTQEVNPVLINLKGENVLVAKERMNQLPVLQVKQNVSSTQNLGITTKTKQETKSRTTTVFKTSNIEIQKPREMLKLNEQQTQISRLKLRELSKQIQRQRTKEILRQETQKPRPKEQRIKEPKIKIKIPPFTLGNGKKEKIIEKSGFKATGFRFGKEVKLGGGTKEQAEKKLETFLVGTLGASGYLSSNGKKLKAEEISLLGKGYRKSKISSFKIVELKERRLKKGTREVPEIQTFRKSKKFF